ncbi:MAG: preprotein translocase subunit SecG [Anaerolinea sp.]|nr:preprotein translocase subunit SecG [Anaerolinea sp.]HRI57967.1 preprotein translocase subunit SecG [Anaerolineae bacterium]
MSTVFFIVQIILSILLIALVSMQSKNLGTSAMFGGSDSFQTSRRGFERTLFNLTVAVSVLFFLVAVASAMLF